MLNQARIKQHLVSSMSDEAVGPGPPSQSRTSSGGEVSWWFLRGGGDGAGKCAARHGLIICGVTIKELLTNHLTPWHRTTALGLLVHCNASKQNRHHLKIIVII